MSDHCRHCRDPDMIDRVLASAGDSALKGPTNQNHRDLEAQLPQSLQGKPSR